MNQTNQNRTLQLLTNYFEVRNEITFAFLFGSVARGKVRKDGDVDIAIYFWLEEDIEWEAFNKIYKEENSIARDLEKLLKKEVDLVVLNRARAILADEILRKGTPILIKDRGIFLDFFCIISDEAEYMRDWFATNYKERKIASNRY
jgi:predicted nucleotidyltransferase